ncbi:Hypothetical protein CINCED_3A009018 [Cinara cedri]|uniref:Uncharacterized protein n=1 Tax=Cinara cedri TaxID=506608 RepID=A0A5E4MAB5_9HEMI|nr:Hypothetical protein CINCED_3A009018 [Cinara cedri]
MSSRKGTDILTSGENQKQTSITAKTKLKRTSNASDSPPGPINLTKKTVKKPALAQKATKLDQKNPKQSKIAKKNEKESEDSDEKKDLVKKPGKQKLKEKLTTKTVKKSIKDVKKVKNLTSGNSEKVEKLLPKPKKLALKKSEDKEEKKTKEKVQKEKVKEVKKKPNPKLVKKNVDEIESIKSRVDITKPEKKDKPKKGKVIAKNKGKLNLPKKILNEDDKPPIECLDVLKNENPDDVALLQVFQLKNGPVCDFDGGVCNTITIRQDNTCIKIKEISVSQLPYTVKTEENEKIDVTSMPIKKESKQNPESQTVEKHDKPADKPKTEKLKSEKLKTEKQKNEKQKPEKPEKQKIEKQKIEKPIKKVNKVEKKKKPIVVDKIKPKGKTKVVPKPKPKGRPVSKRPRVASLNAIAKVHCLYENESKSALIDAMAASAASTISAPSSKKKRKGSDCEMPVRKGKRTSKRTTPGLKSVGRHWDMHDTSSTNSSSSGVDDVKYEPPKSAKRTKKQPIVKPPDSTDDDEEEPEEEPVKSPKEVTSPAGGSKRKRRNADTVTMDLKDMVVKKRMASLNASAILAASYSTEKKLPSTKVQDCSKKSTTSSEVSSERSEPEDDAEDEDSDGHRTSSTIRPVALKPAPLPPIIPPPSSQLAVIVNQDTDVTITTGVYVNSTTRSTRHEEFCTISGLQYRISSTSHTQTEATAVATETLLHADHVSVAFSIIIFFYLTNYTFKRIFIKSSNNL